MVSKLGSDDGRSHFEWFINGLEVEDVSQCVDVVHKLEKLLSSQNHIKIASRLIDFPIERVLEQCFQGQICIWLCQECKNSFLLELLSTVVEHEQGHQMPKLLHVCQDVVRFGLLRVD